MTTSKSLTVTTTTAATAALVAAQRGATWGELIPQMTGRTVDELIAGKPVAEAARKVPPAVGAAVDERVRIALDHADKLTRPFDFESDRDFRGRARAPGYFVQRRADDVRYVAAAGGAGVLAAHNAAFDSAFVPAAPRVGWLCTWRCAMHLWPDAPAHGNQVLRYWLPGLDDELRAIAPGLLVPHRALADALVTSLVLARLARLRPVEDLVALTLEPVLLRVVRFGKHRGELWSEVPRDYLRWVLRAGDFDADVVHTARTHLG